MGLELRGNRITYYRKKRTGSRVVSVYVASGDLALVCYQLDQMKRKKPTPPPKDFDTRAVILKQCDHLYGQIVDELEALGYHRSNRSLWRKARTLKGDHE